VKAALGGAIVALHALGFAALAARCHGTELAVEVRAAPASPALAIEARVPPALAGRVAIDDSAAGPGLHRRRWTVRYRGGAERSVGAAQLVGPFQEPARPRCVGRVVVGQRLLDDGRAGPGTIASEMQRELAAELGGDAIFGLGELRRIEPLALRWALLDAHPGDRALVGEAPHGYVRASTTLVFERVAVPIVVALVPEPRPGAFAFRLATHAGLAFDNRVVQWVSDRLGVERLATRLARRQLDDALITALAPPPPLVLSDGQTIRFTYCDEPPEIADGAYGALPFGIALTADARDPRILPPALGHGPRPVPAAATALALDLDLDALNALLYELWRGGTLDRQLADAGLERRFNSDPTVAALLTLRLAAVRLALPPVVTVAGTGLRLAADARVALHDGATLTTGRVWAGLDFRFAGSATPLSVALGELELACERAAADGLAPTGPRAAPDRPVTLVPCYGDLVAAMRGRAAEFHAALTEPFARLVTDLFIGRFGAVGLPADLAIRGVVPSVAATTTNATVHLELDGSVASRP